MPWACWSRTDLLPKSGYCLVTIL